MPKVTVAHIAKTRDDVGVVIETIVQSGDKDVHVGVILLHTLATPSEEPMMLMSLM